VTRPLEDVVVGISISEGEDLARHGLTGADVNRVTVELCRRLIGLGAQVVLGHKWMPGGIMQAVARFAQAYQPNTTQPIVHNYLGWPDRASLSASERATLKTLVNVVETPADPQWPESESRIRALSRMREQMTGVNHARLFLAGRWTPKSGRAVAGVVEEAAMTAQAGKAMYPSRMMGGAAAHLIRVIRGETPPPSPADEVPAHRECIAILRRFSLNRLAQQSGLDEDDMEALFDAQNIDTVMYFATRGMRALAQEGRLGSRSKRW
jgi:hypothetical protein